MVDFLTSLHPDDLGSWHQGDARLEQERSDTAVTDWLDGYQPTLEPIEALIPARKDESDEHQRIISE